MAQLDRFAHAPVPQLLTGHFHEQSGYRAYRANGVGDWLLIYTASGSGRFGHAGGDLVTAPGDWVLIRPGTLHDYAVAPVAREWELIWAHFQPRQEWLPWLAWPEVSPGVMLFRDPGAASAECLLEVHRLFHSDLRRREAHAMNALERVFLICDGDNASAGLARYDERVVRAIDFLNRNHSQRLSVSDVAAAVGLSSSRLSHLFQTETGQTVQRYLEAMRMQRAGELLGRTSFSVKQIADAVGFDSPFYFSQRFKRWALKSPVAFRADAQSKPSLE